jgi:hypothetical protein
MLRCCGIQASHHSALSELRRLRFVLFLFIVQGGPLEESSMRSVSCTKMGATFAFVNRRSRAARCRTTVSGSSTMSRFMHSNASVLVKDGRPEATHQNILNTNVLRHCAEYFVYGDATKSTKVVHLVAVPEILEVW